MYILVWITYLYIYKYFEVKDNFTEKNTNKPPPNNQNTPQNTLKNPQNLRDIISAVHMRIANEAWP